jgi:hypothetical protein
MVKIKKHLQFKYNINWRCFFIYKFNDEVHSYQSFIRNNIDKIGNLKIVTEQFKIKNNFIDMLAYDSNDDRLAIIELKNVETNHDIIGQAIRYYDLLKRSTAYNNLPIIKDPKILLISPDFDEQLISSISHINNIDIKILKANLDDDIFICEEYQPEKFNDIVGTNRIDIECNKKEIYTIESYNIEKKQLDLIKDCIRIFQNMYNQSLSIFYSKDKINIMYKKSVICTIKISYNWFDNTINISVPKGTVNEMDIRYNPYIKKFTINKKHIKLICNKLPKFIRSDKYGGNT